MPNIFQSKEVFKKTPNNLHDGNAIVPVRGVYVSGEYRPPYYQIPGIRITDISSQKATIVDFTTEYAETTSPHTVGLLGFSANNSMTIQRYSKEYENWDDINTVGMMGFSVEPLKITKFGRDYIDGTDENTVGMIGFSVTGITKLIRRKTINEDQLPEPCLRLTKIETTIATIEDYKI